MSAVTAEIHGGPFLGRSFRLDAYPLPGQVLTFEKDNYLVESVNKSFSSGRTVTKVVVVLLEKIDFSTARTGHGDAQP